MTKTIDSSKLTSLIAQAENLQTQLQELVDAMKDAADATSDAAGDISHPPVGDGTHN